MHKEVWVTVRGTRTDDLGEEETVELGTKGNYFQKNASYYITYAESEISGLAGTFTAWKAEPARVVLNKMGTTEVRQVFEEGIRHRANYITPYGSLFIGVLPCKVEVDLTEGGGSIKLEYELEMSRKRVGYHALSIIVEEV